MRRSLSERRLLTLLLFIFAGEVVFFSVEGVLSEKSLWLGFLSFWTVLYLSLLFLGVGIEAIFLFLNPNDIGKLAEYHRFLVYTFLWITGFLLWSLALRVFSKKFKLWYYLYALFLAVLTGVMITFILLKI